jgi:hypothetical protein
VTCCSGFFKPFYNKLVGATTYKNKKSGWNKGNERKRKKRRRKQKNQEMMADFKYICITSVGVMEGCWLKF